MIIMRDSSGSMREETRNGGEGSKGRGGELKERGGGREGSCNKGELEDS